MSCEFLVFCHFVTILKNLVIFRISYLCNQMRFSKTFFTVKFFSEYTCKIANLLWQKVIFYCQSFDVIFTPKTVRSKIQKHTIVGNTKFYYLASLSSNSGKLKNWFERDPFLMTADPTVLLQISTHGVSRVRFTLVCLVTNICYKKLAFR